MLRNFFATALVLLAAGSQAQTFTASLTPSQVVGGGTEGASGFATLEVSQNQIFYNVLINSLETPTDLGLYRGLPGQEGVLEVALNPSFTQGFATGSVSISSQQAAAILTNPEGYYLQLATGNPPQAALRGQLQGEAGSAATTVYAPVLSRVAGMAGTNFVTDLTLSNRESFPLTVEITYYPSEGSALEPVNVEVPAGGQKVIGNVLQQLWNASGRGAAVLSAPGRFSATARVYNDQRNNGNFPLPGTFNQFFSLQDLDGASSQGILSGLANEPAGNQRGYRTNIGFFNPNADRVHLYLAACQSDGSILATNTIEIPAHGNDIRSVESIFGSALSEVPEFFVRFTVTEGTAFVFGSMVDNITGDAVTILPSL